MICPQCAQPVPEGAVFCPACGTRLPASTAAAATAVDQIAAPSRLPAGVVAYGGFWRRLVAHIIDNIVIGIVTFPLRLIVPFTIFTESDPAGMIGKILGVVCLVGIVAWLYYAGFESSPWQATPGKRLIRLRVTDMTGVRIGLGRASGRFFGKILSGLVFCLGFVMAAFTARKQALHDLLAGTVVVR